jgi:hypothetical protein
MQKAAVLIGLTPSALSSTTVDMANAIVIGFGACWFKSQLERVILQKTAVVAANN